MNNKSVSLDDTLANNAFYDKYKTKIAALQQSDPQKLAVKLEHLTEAKKPVQSRLQTELSSLLSSASTIQPKTPLKRTNSRGEYTQIPVKKLDTIMKIELLTEKSDEEIKMIWHAYFKDKVAVSGVLPKALFEELHEKAMKYPTFLFALPRNEGYEFMVCQFSGYEAHFTSLINFQTYGENSPECLTLVYYADLAEEKGIVLLRGEYDKNILTGTEAQCLVNQVMLYYATPTKRKSELLEQFSRTPDTFQHNDLITELENIALE